MGPVQGAVMLVGLRQEEDPTLAGCQQVSKSKACIWIGDSQTFFEIFLRKTHAYAHGHAHTYAHGHAHGHAHSHYHTHDHTHDHNLTTPKRKNEKNAATQRAPPAPQNNAVASAPSSGGAATSNTAERENVSAAANRTDAPAPRKPAWGLKASPAITQAPSAATAAANQQRAQQQQQQQQQHRLRRSIHCDYQRSLPPIQNKDSRLAIQENGQNGVHPKCYHLRLFDASLLQK